LGSFCDLNCIVYRGILEACTLRANRGQSGSGEQPDELDAEVEGAQPEDLAEEEQPHLLGEEDLGEESEAMELRRKPKLKVVMNLNKQLGWLKAVIAAIRNLRQQGLEIKVNRLQESNS
jgi:hypothetical protein